MSPNSKLYYIILYIIINIGMQTVLEILEKIEANYFNILNKIEVNYFNVLIANIVSQKI